MSRLAVFPVAPSTISRGSERYFRITHPLARVEGLTVQVEESRVPRLGLGRVLPT